MAKMTVITERCKGCGLCTAACPKKIVVIRSPKFISGILRAIFGIKKEEQ